MVADTEDKAMKTRLVFFCAMCLGITVAWSMYGQGEYYK